MPLTPQQLSNLRTIATAAIKCELTSAIPADFICAQCILESAWLKICPGNNCFGIKDYPGSYGRQLLLTREWFNERELAWFLHLGDRRSATVVDSTVPPNAQGRQQYRVYDWFATFPDLAACFARRSQLFRYGAYAEAQAAYSSSHNLDAYIRAVSLHYATAPNYAEKVMAVIKMQEVQDALYEAREELLNKIPA